MAGEISQEVAVALALSSAAIGAGGSIASQIVAGVITSRREKRKAAADEKRWILESDAKRRDRNLDEKTALFVRFLAEVEGIEAAEAWGTRITSEQHLEYQPKLDELRRMVEEIGLIAPDVYLHAKKTFFYTKKMLLEKTPFRNSNRDDATSLAVIVDAEEALQFWLSHTRAAVRSYINHEPVVLPEELEHLMKVEQRKRRNSIQQAE